MNLKKAFQISTMINSCHPLPFLQYSPFIEFCKQIALGVFQILKALILTRPIKIHFLNLWCKVYEHLKSRAGHCGPVGLCTWTIPGGRRFKSRRRQILVNETTVWRLGEKWNNGLQLGEKWSNGLKIGWKMKHQNFLGSLTRTKDFKWWRHLQYLSNINM